MPVIPKDEIANYVKVDTADGPKLSLWYDQALAKVDAINSNDSPARNMTIVRLVEIYKTNGLQTNQLLQSPHIQVKRLLDAEEAVLKQYERDLHLDDYATITQGEYYYDGYYDFRY